MSNLYYYTALIQNLNNIKLEKLKILSGDISSSQHIQNLIIIEIDSLLLDCHNAICELFYSSIESELKKRIVKLYSTELSELYDKHNSHKDFSQKYPFIYKAMEQTKTKLKKL